MSVDSASVVYYDDKTVVVKIGNQCHELPRSAVESSFELVPDDDKIEAPAELTPQMDEAFTKMVDAHTAEAFGHMPLEDTVLMFFYLEVELWPGSTLTFAKVSSRIYKDRRAERYVTDKYFWDKAATVAWQTLKDQIAGR